jgi:D-amino peptidase
VVVNDGHWSATNILIEELNPAATLITGQIKPYGQVQGVGPDVDAIFMVGYHAAAGTLGGVLAHTVIRPLMDVWVNGRPIGEIGLAAAVAGELGVPVVLVTGDRATTEEAKALLGEIETVTVKEGIGAAAAENLAPEVARQKIREAAQRAVSLRPSPFIIQPPITVRVRFEVGAQADGAALLPGSRRVDGRTVEWTAEEMHTIDRLLMVVAALSTLV